MLGRTLEFLGPSRGNGGSLPVNTPRCPSYFPVSAGNAGTVLKETESAPRTLRTAGSGRTPPSRTGPGNTLARTNLLASVNSGACCTGHVHRVFTLSWFYWGMDASAGKDYDADLPPVWRTFAPGAETRIRKPGSSARTAIAGGVPLDGSVVFAWNDGQSWRRLHLAGDPLVVLPELEHTDAF